MNKRVKEKLRQKIQSILDNNFNIDDIEILLINIRDYARANKYNLLLEFCDFVAHPDREKGIIYEELDCQYSKFKYMETQNGENLNYYKIPNVVFHLLFIKSLELMSDTFLLCELQMNRNQLKNFIQQKLTKKLGKNVTVINDDAKIKLKHIQEVLNKQPELHEMTESKLLDELEICFKSLSHELNITFDAIKFKYCQVNLLLFFLDIINECKINLHDGKTAKGYLTVGDNNDVYMKAPSISNLNICFSGEIPVQQSQVVFELIQTSLFVGRYIQEPDILINWKNANKTYGMLNDFKINKIKQNR